MLEFAVLHCTVSTTISCSFFDYAESAYSMYVVWGTYRVRRQSVGLWLEQQCSSHDDVCVSVCT